MHDHVVAPGSRRGAGPAAVASGCGRSVGTRCQDGEMGRLASFDTAAVTDLVRRQDGVICRSQAAACGMTEAAMRHRIRPDGPWQVVLPGVYLSSRGAM